MRSLAHLSAAPRLLLASGGPKGVEGLDSRFDGSRLDWELLLALSQHERATAVLWPQLRDSQRFRPPDDVAERLQRLAAIARFHALHVESRLQETVRVFAERNLPVILLKGAALASTVYSSWVERPMGDLDILIDPADVLRARDAARAAGWVEAEELYPPQAYERHQHLAPLLDQAGTGLSLELHTELCLPGHSFGVSLEELRRDAVWLERFPGTVMAPTPIHSLLHLAVHFAWSHLMRFGTWRTIRDLTALTTHAPSLWSDLGKAAVDRRAASCVYWTLRIARDAGGVEVPAELLRGLTPYRTERMVGALARHLELHVLPADVPCPSDWLNQFLWRVAIRPQWSGHGSIRPANTPMAESAVPVRRTFTRKVIRHSRRLGLWSRYVHRVLFAGSAT